MVRCFQNKYLPLILGCFPYIQSHYPDISEEDISEEDISEEDISEEDISEEDISEEDISEEDFSEECILKVQFLIAHKTRGRKNILSIV